MTTPSGVVHITLFNQGAWCLAVAPGPSALSPAGQIPGALVQMTPASDSNNNVWDSFGDNQTYWNGSQPGQVREWSEGVAILLTIMDQDAVESHPPTPTVDHSSGQTVTFPFAQTNDVQFHDPNPFVNEFHDRRVSPQPFPTMPIPHSMSQFQPHPDQIADTPASTGPQWEPEISNPQGARHRGTGSEECPHGNCDKSYGRRQDLKRHIRDRHGIRPRCPSCGFESTRAERIRRHLITQHRDRFSRKERQDIRRLRGWEATIRLLEKRGTTP